MKLILDRVLSASADREAFLTRLRAKALEGIPAETIARAEANARLITASDQSPEWLGSALRGVTRGN